MVGFLASLLYRTYSWGHGGPHSPKSEGRRALTKQFCRVKKQENQPLPVSLLQLVVKIEHSKKTEG